MEISNCKFHEIHPNPRGDNFKVKNVKMILFLFFCVSTPGHRSDKLSI